MELRTLRYFLTVAREESISLAAASLHITQPTLSRQLKELEDEIGYPLFERGNRSRKLVLTEKGQLLRRRAQEIIYLADRTELELMEDEEVSGSITIGGAETNLVSSLMKACARLNHTYPDITYNFVSLDSRDLSDQLDQGLLDFGMFLEEPDTKVYETLKLPGHNHWGILCKKEHPLARYSSITLESLQGIPLIVSREILLQEPQWFEELTIKGTYNLIYNGLHMMEADIGVIMCIDHTTTDGYVFVPLQLPELSLYLAWKKYRHQNKASQLLLEELQITE